MLLGEFLFFLREGGMQPVDLLGKEKAGRESSRVRERHAVGLVGPYTKAG